MCACFCGHDETALTLRDKNPASLKIKNFFGQSCQDVASSQALKSSLAGGNDASSPFVVPCSPAPDGSLFLPPGKFRTKSLDGRSSVSPFRVVPVRAIKSSTPAGSGGQLQLPGPGHLDTKRQLSKRASLDIGGVSGSAGGGNGSNAIPSKSPIPAYQVKL